MDWIAFFIFLAGTAGAAATGSLFPPGSWYQRLTKPSWTPPGKAFPIVWTTLYVLMAIAAARVSHAGAGIGVPLALWSLQLVLNTLWTPVFFGLHRVKLGLMIIAGLWVAVLATLIAFWSVDTLAGLLMAPYLVWVSVAAALNRAILRDNADIA